jgi:hypothetical protein
MKIDNIIRKIILGPEFVQFLDRQKNIPKKQRPFYLRWVAVFCEHVRSLDASPHQADRNQFLEKIAPSREDWQVRQAGGAAALDLYFLTEINGKEDNGAGKSKGIAILRELETELI